MKHQYKRGSLVELTIDDLAFGGKGIARIPTEKGHYIIFVPNTIPGQKVTARITRARNQHAEAKLADILEPSPREQEIPYQAIPGAPYARLPIAEQVEFKKQSTIELFKRIGGFEDIETAFDEFIEAPETWHYRNKMEYSFSAIRYDFDIKGDVDDFGLGFKHRGTWWMVENLDKESGLFDAEVENNLKEVREFFISTGLPPWHPPKKEGFFRFLIVRRSFDTGKLLFELVTTSTDIEQFDQAAYVQKMQSLFGDRLAGLLHSINDDIGDRSRSSSGAAPATVLVGEDALTEKVLGLNFEMSMSSFFQPNPKCAALLYEKALSYLNAPGLEYKQDDVIMDLFCGTGTIAQVMASRLEGCRVVGVDIVASAIEDAKKNAIRNGVNKVEFYAADVNKFLYEYPEFKGKIKSIILDPPRAGIAPKALARMLELEAQRVVYVSCNPATQARDARTLADAGYTLKQLSMVDQFPHTAHIETVALFEKGS